MDELKTKVDSRATFKNAFIDGIQAAIDGLTLRSSPFRHAYSPEHSVSSDGAASFLAALKKVQGFLDRLLGYLTLAAE